MSLFSFSRFASMRSASSISKDSCEIADMNKIESYAAAHIQTHFIVFELSRYPNKHVNAC